MSLNWVKLGTTLAFLMGWGTSYAQYGAVTGYCVKGATPATTSGLNSVNTLQGVVPGGPAGCLVQVYLTGTTTPATIYSTAGGASLNNPFRASLSGQWLFYAAAGPFDVVLSSGLPPNNYINPVTLTGLGPSGGGGSSFTLNAASFPPLSGAVIIACGAGLACTQSGQTITVSISSPFTINSFTGCGGSFELGFANVNPTCSATYSGTPSSANITNTEGIDSPLALTTPFTSGTIIGTFTHSAVASTTVTLTAIGSSTQTANQTMTWNPRSFGGVGVAGATSSVTAAGTTAVLSNSVVLPSIDLAASNVGTTYGPFVTSGNNVYLLILGGSHTFVDTGTGFPFAFNAPLAVSFVNVNGVTVNMFLYQSSNPLFGSFNIRVAS